MTVTIPPIQPISLRRPVPISRPQAPMSAPLDTVRFSGVDDDKLTQAYKTFGFQMFDKITSDPKQAGKNVVISPTSVGLALSMALNGAKGDTRKYMLKAMAMQGLTLDKLNAANATLIKTLSTIDPAVTMSIANSLWADKQAQIKPGFTKRTQAAYDASMSTVDFRNNGKDAEKQINDWVKLKTQGMIPGIVKDPPPETLLYLVNAIFFKGDWTSKFDEKKTDLNGKFTAADKSVKTVPMMNQSGEFQYQENKDFQAINLPYGEGKMSMVILLPKGDVDTFRTQLNTKNWDQWMSQFNDGNGTIKMPRYKTDFKVNLNDTLKSLGMGVAFDEQLANFKDMVTPPPGSNVCIGTVDHKTALEVDEKGSKAAAVTGIGMVFATSVRMPAKRFNMEVNRPFVLAIQDNATNTPLFLGVIKDPTAVS
jgi:serine protease inhibitor